MTPMVEEKINRIYNIIVIKIKGGTLNGKRRTFKRIY